MPSTPIVADALAPFMEAFGRLHPLAVHLPIGLVVAAFLVEAFRAVQRRQDASPFTPVALWIAALGAAASSATGWFFAEGNSASDDLFWHRWLGVLATVALAGLAWMATRAAGPDRERAVNATPAVRGALVAVTVLVAWVGHLGGNMVWGTNHVLEQIEQQLLRLVPVIKVIDVTNSTGGIERELALVKVAATGEKRVESLCISEIFRARVIDTTNESFIFEVTGASQKIDQFVELMRPLGLVEVSRTGVLSIQRGKDKAG